MVRSPLPTTVLGGFLGAGKTTLVNHLLHNAEGRRITVLVNDFGELAIDLDLIEARDGAKISLANGCACCSTGGDLARALNQLLDAPERPDRLLIEASGVADPARLADLARADPDLVLAGIVVVADRGRIVDLVSDPRIGAQVARQLAAADLVILNKQDLPAPQELEGLLHRLAPQAAVVRATEAVVPVDLILGELSPRGAWWAEAASNIDHEDTYDRWAMVGGAAVSLDDLRSRLAALPPGILRLKGFIPLQDGRTAIVQASTGQQKIVVAPPRPLLAMRLVAIGVRGLFAPAELDRLFARQARQSSARTLENAILNSESALEGRVKVAARDGLAGLILSTQLLQFLQDNPAIDVVLDTARHADRPLAGEVDLTLTFAAPTLSDLVAAPLAHFHFSFFAAESYLNAHGTPRSVEDLA